MLLRQLPLSLVALPTKVNIDIAGHLAATSERPMDDLRSLRATCQEMRRVSNNTAVGRRMALERFAVELQWNDRKGYDVLLDCLTHIRNLEACFLSGMDILFGKTTALDHPSPSSRRPPRPGTMWRPT